jgi:DNA-binding NtrC family response regulator
MKDILLTWIGNADVKAMESKHGGGPIAQALSDRHFDAVLGLTNFSSDVQAAFLAWLSLQSKAEVGIHPVELTSPTNFGEIFLAARGAIERLEKLHPGPKRLAFLLSPGTPAMAAVWIVLSKTSSPARLLETSVQQGTQDVDFPFDLLAEFLPDLRRRQDEDLARLAAGHPKVDAAFADVAYRCEAMNRVVGQAAKVAIRSVPVLLQGESGSGKELFARAIHNASPRANGPFVAVNCGAIPAELVDAEFFGHAKGAFTGAVTARKGHFESARGGTIFLDEIGELPLPSQVKLLRVLQEGKVQPLGTSAEVAIDMRVIAATNRSLIDEVGSGRFREDLFHRVAVGILQLPPLRDRSGDLSMLVDRLLDVINEEAADQPAYTHKKLSVGARKLLAAHDWPGNIRELRNTLLRASLWSAGQTIEAADVSASILRQASRGAGNVLDKLLGSGFDVAELVRGVEEHYVRRALDEAHGNKTKAAELLGLSSYQTLTNWMQRLKIDT